MKSPLLFCMALLLMRQFNLHAQSEAAHNEFYWYNEHVYSPTRLVPLDTMNYCRVKQSRIKSVTTVRFYTSTQWQQVQRIEYDSAGIPLDIWPRPDSAQFACLSCVNRSFKPAAHKRREHTKGDNSTEIWIYDKNNYLIEYRDINRSAFAPLINHWFGCIDSRITYTYSNHYMSVTELHQRKKTYAPFDRWEEPHYRYEYTVDVNGNLSSEFAYVRRDSGEFTLQWGYTYHYEYY